MRTICLLTTAASCLWLAPAFAEIPPVLDARQSAQNPAISYVTGGVGLAERDYLSSVKEDYSLKIEAALSSGEFIADVVVTIAQGDDVLLETELDGPQLLAALPAGQYQVTLHYGEEEKTQKTSVPAKGRRDLMFVFKPQPEEDAPKTSLPPLHF